MRRANGITLASRRIGEVGQWSNPLACRVRDAVMKRLPQAAQMRQLEATLRYRL